jgi:hypothetical protein
MKSVMLFMAPTLVLLCVSIHLVEASEQQYKEPDCMMSAGPCIKTVDGLTVAFDINPKPLKAMRSLLFRTTITNQGRSVADASVSIDLSMPDMFMGQNVIGLSHLRDGIYEGKGVIIRCPGGKKIWRASVAIHRAGNESVVDYIFEVP